MIILGLDVATTTGWAIYNTDRHMSSIETGSFHCDGKTTFQKVISMRQHMPALLRRLRPDFAAIEEPLPFVPSHKKKSKDMMGETEQAATVNPKTVMDLNRLAGAAQMAVMGMNIECVGVYPVTWKAIIPKGYQGTLKQKVARFCHDCGVTGTNADKRDAAIIAIWAAGRCQELKLMKRASEAA